MRTILYVVATPDGLDLRVGEEANLSNLGAVLITFDVPVSRLIDGIPELRERISTLTRERDEAKAEVERLRAVVQDLCEVLEECVDEIDTFYGPPGSNRIDRELIARARAVLAKAREEGAMKVYLVVAYSWDKCEHMSAWASRDAAEREAERLLRLREKLQNIPWEHVRRMADEAQIMRVLRLVKVEEMEVRDNKHERVKE